MLSEDVDLPRFRIVGEQTIGNEEVWWLLKMVSHFTQSDMHLVKTNLKIKKPVFCAKYES